MKQVVTTIKRGNAFVGQVISDSAAFPRDPYIAQVTIAGEVHEDDRRFFDEDEAVERLDHFMADMWAKYVTKRERKNASTI